jgi:hypothetical protein
MVGSFEPVAIGPTVEVMSQGEAGEHPGSEVLKAEADVVTTCPMVLQLPIG